MRKTILSAAVAAMLALPVLAQDNPVKINGSLIDWYYYGCDWTGSTSGEGWNQQPTGNGAWIDTETGQATLIGMTNFADVEMEYDDNGQLIGAHTNRYGKMQMTGIYVDGSIVKPSHDLKVTLNSCPTQMSAGETATITATVKNIGTKAVRGSHYSMCLFADDKIIATIDDSDLDSDVFTDNLRAGQSQKFTFTDATPPIGATYTVVAVYEEGESLHSNSVDGSGIIEQAKGDVNGDSSVDVADIAFTIDVMSSGRYGSSADVNGDGSVDVADTTTFTDIMAK